MAARRPVKRWVHFSEEGGDPWVLPIWSAVNAAIRGGRSRNITKRLSELGVHISTRLNLLPHAIRRVNEGTVAVNATLANLSSNHVFLPGLQAQALRIDKTLKFHLLLDVDSLLFEMNSLYELWSEFFKAFHLHANVEMPAASSDQSIRWVLEKGGGSTRWIDELRKERNYFTHRGAPYLAVDVSRKHYDLVFLRSNVIDLDASNDYIRLSELNDMVQGFRKAKPLIRDYLAGLYV